jgi:hypothetical protein
MKRIFQAALINYFEVHSMLSSTADFVEKVFPLSSAVSVNRPGIGDRLSVRVERQSRKLDPISQPCTHNIFDRIPLDNMRRNILKRR